MKGKQRKSARGMKRRGESTKKTAGKKKKKKKNQTERFPGRTRGGRGTKGGTVSLALVVICWGKGTGRRAETHWSGIDFF